jgi:hypothetical protein
MSTCDTNKDCSGMFHYCVESPDEEKYCSKRKIFKSTCQKKLAELDIKLEGTQKAGNFDKVQGDDKNSDDLYCYIYEPKPCVIL